MVEGQLMPDHVLMLLSIAPKYPMARLAISRAKVNHIWDAAFPDTQRGSYRPKSLAQGILWSPVGKDENHSRLHQDTTKRRPRARSITISFYGNKLT